MKNLKLTSWLFIAFIALYSCKTKDLKVSKSVTDVQTDVAETTTANRDVVVENSTALQEHEVQQMLQLLQSLNIAYNGKELNDKLDFLLKKSDEGLKLTVQGKGTANYSESYQQALVTLKKELFKRQDSLNSEQINILNSLQADVKKFLKDKDKEVEVQGIHAGGYITIVIIVVVLTILAWIAWRFNLFRK